MEGNGFFGMRKSNDGFAVLEKEGLGWLLFYK
jgi:hypothetical protein